MVKKLGDFISKIYVALVFILLYAPIVTLMIFSFNKTKSMAVWGGFTFDWYSSLLENDRIIAALYYTVLIAVIASVVATVIGTISAIGINNMKKGPRTLLLNVNYLPVLNPDIVTGISLMTLFAIGGVLFNLKPGFWTMLLAHITFDIPYVILSVLPKLRQLPPNLTDAALDLGAKPSYALRKVVIPQIIPGIAAGFLIAFTMSIDDFVISFFTTGPGVSNLSIEIYSMARRGISPEINALSTLMFIVVLALLLIANRKQSLVKGER